MASIEGLVVHHRERTGSNRLFKQGCFIQEPAYRIDKGTDTGIGRSGHGHVVFNRPENDHRKMLIRGAGLPKPGIVCDVDQELSTVLNH